MATITITYTVAGTYKLAVPTDVSSIQVELWGAGGNGGGKTANGGGGGGGGGAYAKTTNVSVTGGTEHTIVVGAPSAVGTGNGGNGANSTFDSTVVVAAGGTGGGGGTGSTETGGAGGTTAASTGATKAAGGAGGATSLSTDGGAGGGEAGGSGGTGGTGGNGTTTGVAGSGGTGVNTDGGDGGAGRGSTQGVGNNGVAPGGGGGGAYRTAANQNGGQGAAGQAKITFTTSLPALTNYGSAEGATTTFTIPVKVENSNSTLLVGIGAFDSASGADTVISSITYNGNAMTQADKSEFAGGGGAGSSNYAYSLGGLSAGTADLVITFTANVTDPGVVWSVIANTASTLDAHQLDTVGSPTTPVTGDLTTSANNSVVWSWAGFDSVGGATATGADQTEIGNVSSGFIVGSVSRTAKTPAGSVTHTYTPASSDAALVFLMSVAPFSSTQDIAPNVLASTTTLHSPTITTGSVNVAPNLLTTTTTIHNPTITTGSVNVAPNVLATTTTFYSPTITVGAVDIAPNLLTTTTTIHSPTVSLAAASQDIQPTLLESVTTIHSPTVTQGDEPDPPVVTPPRPIRQHTRTVVEILNSSLNKVAEVRNLVPINEQGFILQYSKELSDFGTCRFKVSTRDPIFTEFGDILEPHRYHIRIKRGGVVVWSGVIVDNPSRNKNYVEVKGVEYEYYFDKVLIRRDTVAPSGADTTNDSWKNYRTFSSGTMASAVQTMINDAVTDFGTTHAISDLTINNIDNPSYPPGFVDANGSPLTGGWTFSDFLSLQFDYHSVGYVLKAFGLYADADYELDENLEFNFQEFIGNKQPHVTFRYGRQGNVVNYDLPRLGGRMTNDMWGIATTPEGVVLNVNQRDEASVQSYGLLQGSAAYADVKDANMLRSRLSEELQFVKSPETSPVNLTVDETAYPAGMYDIGDIVNVEIHDHIISYTSPRRIVGITVTLHNTGRELTVLQTNQPKERDMGQ
jgi:hypothetical protein